MNRSTLPESNPFADPSVTQLIAQHHSSADSADGIVRNFNPFVEEIGTKRESAVGPTNQEVVETATRDLKRQQESLDSAANRLESYQPDLQIQTVIQSDRINNCPPLPPCCPISPCFYQNISEEIPQQFQLIVRFHFYFWIVYWIHLLINAGGCLAWLLVVEEKGKIISGFSFVISIVYFFVLAPCSYAWWFHPLYRAFRSEGSLGFSRYFVSFLGQIFVLILDSLGFHYYGTVGWINGWRCFSASIYDVGTFMLVIAIIFDVLALIGFMLILRVNSIYRNATSGQRIPSDQMAHETATVAARVATRSTVGGAFGNRPLLII